MAPPPHTMQLTGGADWALMTAIHDALRRDLDHLLHATASHASARARWGTFRRRLRFHLAAEHAAMWPLVKAKLAGDPHGQVLLDAGASPDIREHVLSQLPAPARLLYRTVWLPRYARTTPPL